MNDSRTASSPKLKGDLRPFAFGIDSEHSDNTISIAMKKFGLALSGGGFRASLYHLGLVRFLRDAGILSQVTHITSVSGGSILAAHLVLNWERYNGSSAEFDMAASEILNVVQMDVRNRITRHFPLNIPIGWVRKLMGLSNRKLTRTGLLEHYYEKYLYGDTSLFELPAAPQLHLLTTNLSEGCLCSFNRSGLMMMRRQGRLRLRIERVPTGLATVAMAVTASSAFPGFFPPLALTGAEVGTCAGEFGRQSFTDGGVFDNLGVRMFRCLERPMLLDSPLKPDDFVDFQRFVDTLRNIQQSPNHSNPLSRLNEILATNSQYKTSLDRLPSEATTVDEGLMTINSSRRQDGLVESLWEVLSHHPLQREPLFAALHPEDPEADALLQAARHGGQTLERDDQLWLNRHLLETAVKQASDHACFRRLSSGMDGVIVSDVGKPIENQSNRRAGGLIRTALRATDILMDRVWQLENETFRDTPGFVFAPITDVVELSEDATAMNPEVQRQASRMRTDLDRFSKLEISSLVRHGYCVARKSCRARPELFGTELPNNEPWDPIPKANSPSTSIASQHRPTSRAMEPTSVTRDARSLQESASRRIVSTLLDYRDWASYVYVPLLMPILFLMPYFVYQAYQESYRMNQIVSSLRQGSQDLERMNMLLKGPMQPWEGIPAEQVQNFDEVDFNGFKVLQDSHILDLREWKPGTNESDSSFVYGYERLKVMRVADSSDSTRFHLRLRPIAADSQFRFPPQELKLSLRSTTIETTDSSLKRTAWEAIADFSKTPKGELVDIVHEFRSPGHFLRDNGSSASLTFESQVKTAELIRWFLLPEGKEYRHFRIVRYEKGNPEKLEEVKVVSEYLATDSSILAFKLLSVDSGYVYEVTWFYK
jgi:predicted acylesterase/phospholipase RssA